MKILVALLFITTTLLPKAEAGKFLFWLPMTARSTKIGVMPTAVELAKKGHEVTVVSAHKGKEKITGLTEIVNTCKVNEVMKNMSMRSLELGQNFPDFTALLHTGAECNKAALNHPKIKRILEKKEKFDVGVVVPIFCNEAGYYVVEKTNATLVQFLPSTHSFQWSNWAVGNPHNPAYMPNVMPQFPKKMNFFERFLNTLVSIAMSLMRSFYIIPMVEGLIEETYPNDKYSGLVNVEESTALLITHGSSFLGDGLRPTMPNTVMSGLMTCQPPKQLPNDLKKFVEGANDGVVYISFGSALKASEMPEEKRRTLLKVFGRLKQRVIWKWEEEMPDAPDNVMVSSWLPQQDLLGHKNVKLFITHGGAGSVQETICHKTPAIGIPFFADQPANLNDVVNRNLAVVMKWTELEEEHLLSTIKKMLADPSYAKAAEKLGDLIMDQPLHPLDHAVWWLEYLLRHQGNHELRSPFSDMPWYQYFLIDVILAIVAILTIVLIFLFNCAKFCCSKCKGTGNADRKKKD